MRWRIALPKRKGLYIYYTGSPMHSYDVLVIEWCSRCSAFEVRSGANWKPLPHFVGGAWLGPLDLPNPTEEVD